MHFPPFSPMLVLVYYYQLGKIHQVEYRCQRTKLLGYIFKFRSDLLLIVYIKKNKACSETDICTYITVLANY